MMKMYNWSHRAAMTGAALWVVTACGGEVRSESDVPDGSEPVVEAPQPERPTLIERDGAVISDLLHNPDAEARAYRERDRVAAEAERAQVAVAEPQPLPRYTTRAEPEGPEDSARSPEPLLSGSDPEGQQVEVEPADDFEPVDATDPTDGPWEEAEADQEPFSVPMGVEMVLTVESELSTERNRPGDLFYAVLTDDVIANDGLVLLPQGTRMRGVVTESLASESSDSLPRLEVSVEAVLTEGGEQPIYAVIVDSDLLIEERDSGEESAVKVLTGAAAGAILGRILGNDKKDAVKGGVAGAAAGAAVALGTRGGHARLDPGARIVIRLERPLVVQE